MPTRLDRQEVERTLRAISPAWVDTSLMGQMAQAFVREYGHEHACGVTQVLRAVNGASMAYECDSPTGHMNQHHARGADGSEFRWSRQQGDANPPMVGIPATADPGDHHAFPTPQLTGKITDEFG